MKFIKATIILTILFNITSCKKRDLDYDSKVLREYKLIEEFSSKLKEKTNLNLYSYGININKPKGYKFINGVINFYVSYTMYLNRENVVSLETARSLLVSVADGLLHSINNNPKVRDDLDKFPFTSDLLTISIYFEDENKISLGNGVSYIYFSQGKIKYEGYEIYEYYSGMGKDYTIHEETYAEALESVNKSGALMELHTNTKTDQF